MKSSMHNPHLAPEKYGIMDGISECIVTTISSKGPNAAPMGIIKIQTVLRYVYSKVQKHMEIL